MKMANEYDDVCTALEVIIGVLYLQKFSTVFFCVMSAKFSRDCVYCKIGGMKRGGSAQSNFESFSSCVF